MGVSYPHFPSMLWFIPPFIIDSWWLPLLTFSNSFGILNHPCLYVKKLVSLLTHLFMFWLVHLHLTVGKCPLHTFILWTNLSLFCIWQPVSALPLFSFFLGYNSFLPLCWTGCEWTSFACFDSVLWHTPLLHSTVCEWHSLVLFPWPDLSLPFLITVSKCHSHQ